MNPRATTAFALVALAFGTLPVHADDTAGAMRTAARTCVLLYAQAHARAMSVTATEIAEAALSACENKIGDLIEVAVSPTTPTEAMQVYSDILRRNAIQAVVEARTN